MLVRLTRHIAAGRNIKNSRPVLLDDCQEEMFTVSTPQYIGYETFGRNYAVRLCSLGSGDYEFSGCERNQRLLSEYLLAATVLCHKPEPI